MHEYSYEVEGRTRTGLYLLVNGIYPHWAIFVRTISEARNQKEKMFSSGQEAMRKDPERALGVLLFR